MLEISHAIGSREHLVSVLAHGDRTARRVRSLERGKNRVNRGYFDLGAGLTRCEGSDGEQCQKGARGRSHDGHGLALEEVVGRSQIASGPSHRKGSALCELDQNDTYGVVAQTSLPT